MATRKQQRRINAMVLLFILGFGGLMVFSIVLIAIVEGLLSPKSVIYADFRDAGSIGPNSEIQLDGKKIGKVAGVEFISATYGCDPRTEDFGDLEAGRTDDCEPWMFCAQSGDDPSEGACAVLEEFSGRPSDYEGCQGLGTCGEGRVCVTRSFRTRYRGVRWWGQAGWCVDYDTEIQRIRVALEVDTSSLVFMTTDSRASVVRNGLLSDPRVNITVGRGGAPIEEGDRLQTSSSLTEEMLALRDEIDRLGGEIDRGLIGLSALTDTLTDEKAKADIEAIGDNMATIRKQLETATGLVGAVLNDPGTRASMSKTLREVKKVASDAQDEYETLERDVKRVAARVETAIDDVDDLLDGLEDPTNTSLVAVLVNDVHGVEANADRLAVNTSEAVGAGKEALADLDAVLDEVMLAVENREGSLGRLIHDPKPLYHIKDPATLQRVTTVKSLVRWVIMADEALGQGGDETDAPDSAGETETTDRAATVQADVSPGE